MQTEAGLTDASKPTGQAAAFAKDPVLLGVTLPLGITIAAASQVKSAWAEALTAVLAAAKAKANAKAAAGKKAAKEQAAEVTA